MAAWRENPSLVTRAFLLHALRLLLNRARRTASPDTPVAREDSGYFQGIDNFRRRLAQFGVKEWQTDKTTSSQKSIDSQSPYVVASRMRSMRLSGTSRIGATKT
jgi:hypothetical protein